MPRETDAYASTLTTARGSDAAGGAPAYASTLTTARGSDSAGGAPAYASTLTTAATGAASVPVYASTLTTATGAGEQQRGLAGLGADVYNSSA